MAGVPPTAAEWALAAGYVCILAVLLPGMLRWVTGARSVDFTRKRGR